MRIRLRHPGGQASIHLNDDATVDDLETQIAKQADLTKGGFDLRYGYPPKACSLDQFGSDSKLSEINIKLDGEQLIVSRSPTLASPPEQKHGQLRPSDKLTQQSEKVVEGAYAKESFTSSSVGTTPKASDNRATPKRKTPTAGQDAPELPLPTHDATLLLRIMPDDNSCLFRAFNSAFFGAMDNMHELRSVVAQHIQANTETYSAVVLEQKPDDYCRWIQTEDAWGGAIELDIFSKHFDIEICSIDVQTLRIDKYNEGQRTRCIIVYSGIHYDVIALSPSDPPHTHSTTPPDFDTKVFDAADEMMLQAAVELCRVLQGKHYYTDIAKFTLKCNTCGAMLRGERGATEHAMETSHTDFGEAS